jgi:D-alanyl-lipoteichoic acid acyltransferase DltB (MBOAT superfamily)
MAWGLFKKVVVADRLAVIVDQVYGAPSSYPGPALVLATMLFAYQIYCDFSGYSDIALGAAEVMGFRLTPNFARPYSATSFADFWRRWHISLSSWFRDYCFFPFGFRRPKWQLRLHLLFVFILSGLWHGANWTFIVWGALHGVFRLAEESTHAVRARVVEHVRLNSGIVYAMVSRVAVFALVSFAWIFFRSTSMSDAMYIASHLFTGYGPLLDGGLGSLLADLNVTRGHLALVLMGLVVVEAVHLHQERYGSVREHVRRLPAFARWSLYHALVAIVMLFGVFNDSQFIYFQF